ncbi:MAG: FIST N-terminal domain-containing protein, partial [Thermoanaerobaculia bacterium]
MSFAIASAFSLEKSSARAVEASVEELERGLGGRRPDLTVLFATAHHRDSLEEALALLDSRLRPVHQIGCAAQGIIANDRELEREAALCLWGASLPGIDLRSGRIEAQETPEGLAFSGLPEVPESPATLLLFADPFDFPAVEFIQRLGEDHPRLQVLGGMASGSMTPGEQ